MFTLTPYKKILVFIAAAFLSAVVFRSVGANGTLAAPPFSQDWSNTALIVTNNDWSNVPSIIGYRGDALTAATDTDPQTILSGDDAAPVVNVLANQTNPNITTGGVAEFHLADPVIALQGSGTADAPYLKIFLNTTGMNNIRVAYNVRDIDGSLDNAVQQVALHYRTGSSGNFTNVPAAYIADATTGPGIATMVTPVSVALPAAVDNQTHVELRIMTTNAAGNDEWVGIDDISITGNYAPTGVSLSPNSVLENQPVGTTVGTLTAADDNAGDTHIFEFAASCAGGGVENVNFSLTGDTLKTANMFDYESKTSYTICVKVTDGNNLSFTGEVVVNVQNIADETPPSVSIEQAAGQPDPTNVSPINFTVVFSESVSNFDDSDILLGGTAGAATATVAEISPNDGTSYNVAVSGMTLDGTVTASVIADAAEDGAGNKSAASTSVDNEVVFSTDTAFPIILFSSNTIPANGSALTAGPSQIQIEFNEDVKHDFSSRAANNTINYLLVEAGANGGFNTASCLGGRMADDVSIMVNAASYNHNGGSGPFMTTLIVNGGAPLGVGSYRLFVCGTTSIEDLIGNELNNGASDTLINFTVSRLEEPSEPVANLTSPTLLPVTGFPKGESTHIPAQPVDKTYASYADLRLEIPTLAVSTPIVGVPLSDNGWDVTWLGKDAGWLNGTAFPTWSGNSVITAHVWDAYNQPGTFYNLKKLRYGDAIQVRAFGQVYVYEVRETKRISPRDVNNALTHEEKAWLTLITCEDYRVLFKTYSYRRMVRAVLVSVTPEK